MKSDNIRLELAWEAVQDVYTTHANIYAYQHLKDFCSFGEDTYLLKIQQKNIQAFYDVSGVTRQAELGLKDFLDSTWRTIFKEKARIAIRRTAQFMEKSRANRGCTKKELIALIQEGTEINQQLFVAFAACQPQYTSLVETYLKKRMPDGLNEEELNRIFLTLTQSEELSPLTKETVNFERISREKAEIISRYALSKELIQLFNDITAMGHLRLQLRIEGWMLLEQVLMRELFPQLAKYFSYTVRQLEATVPEELSRIFEGDTTISPTKLDERYNLLVYGLYKGKEVRWQGREAKEMVAKLIPSIDTSVTELNGQTGWSGRIQGRCYVIHWDAKDVRSVIDSMPDDAILIAGQTRPELIAAIKKASAIVTDEGGLLSHAAIVARELRKPCVIGTKFATKVFKTGDLIEVDAEKGVVRILERKT